MSQLKCAICKLDIKPDSKELPLFGQVGSECYRQFVMITELLKLVQDTKFFPSQGAAYKYAVMMKKSGLKTEVVYRGEDKVTGADRYMILFKGKANQTPAAQKKFGKTYKEYRQGFFDSLVAARAARQQAAGQAVAA